MSEKIDFRPAVKDDLPHIVALLSDDPLGAIEGDRNNLIFLAVEKREGEGETLLGCMQLTFIPGLSRKGMLRGQIESVRVAADRRGEGIGEALFKKAVEICRTQGCELLQLTSDKTRPQALRFYEAFGFEASHEGLKMRL